MSRAEDLAKELFPDWEYTGVPQIDGLEQSEVRIQRVAYIKGYHQAEKDLELSWEDIKLLDKIFMYERVKSGLILGKEEYEKILKRYKDLKK